jgi:hypothetical protein
MKGQTNTAAARDVGDDDDSMLPIRSIFWALCRVVAFVICSSFFFWVAAAILRLQLAVCCRCCDRVPSPSFSHACFLPCVSVLGMVHGGIIGLGILPHNPHRTPHLILNERQYPRVKTVPSGTHD